MEEYYEFRGVSLNIQTEDNYYYGGWPTLFIGVCKDSNRWHKTIKLIPIKPPCPVCEGRGGWTEVICPEIGGPRYDCDFCNTDERISWRKFLLYHYRMWYWDTRIGKTHVDLLIRWDNRAE